MGVIVSVFVWLFCFNFFNPIPHFLLTPSIKDCGSLMLCNSQFHPDWLWVGWENISHSSYISVLLQILTWTIFGIGASLQTMCSASSPSLVWLDTSLTCGWTPPSLWKRWASSPCSLRPCWASPSCTATTRTGQQKGWGMVLVPHQTRVSAFVGVVSAVWECSSRKGNVISTIFARKHSSNQSRPAVSRSWCSTAEGSGSSMTPLKSHPLSMSSWRVPRWNTF